MGLWHAKKSELLHDIICMANNQADRDAYIIIGVDESDNYNICDVTEDANRKNTQKLVDFLKDKKFAGGERPKVRVNELTINEKIIDVIIIYNASNTPYYLMDRYEAVNPNNIYTRNMDTNTPINNSADKVHIKYLWRKRFGIDKTPLERLEIYLSNINSWSYQDSTGIWYNKIFPEFTIRKDDSQELKGYTFYLFSQIDTTPNWCKINIYYHQTMLKAFEGVYLNGASYFTIVPLQDFIYVNKYFQKYIAYRCYIKDNLRYTLFEFFDKYNDSDTLISRKRFLEVVLIYDNEIEKSQFEKYALSHFDDCIKSFDYNKLPYFEPVEGMRIDGFKEEYRNALILKSLLNDYRKNKQK